MKAKKIKYKQDRLEIRVSKQMKDIIDLQVRYRDNFGDKEYTYSKFLREAIAYYLLHVSVNWYSYNQQEQEYIKNNFKD